MYFVDSFACETKASFDNKYQAEAFLATTWGINDHDLITVRPHYAEVDGSPALVRHGGAWVAVRCVGLINGRSYWYSCEVSACECDKEGNWLSSDVMACCGATPKITDARFSWWNKNRENES